MIARALLVGALLWPASATFAADRPLDAPPDTPAEAPAAAAPVPGTSRPSLAEAPKIEKQTIHRLLEAPEWPKRAIAAMRLERYGCDASAALLDGLLDDDAWRVRAFALRTLGRRRVALEPGRLEDEHHPRVVRAALRHRFPFDLDRLRQGIETLARGDTFDDRLLAVELGAASGDEDERRAARRGLRQVVLRMGRSTSGALAERIAALTGHRDAYTHVQWQDWYRRHGRMYELRPAYAVDETSDPVPPSHIAQIDPETFAGFEAYIGQLGRRRVDLAIVLDCTESMGRELADAQAGVTDLMHFVDAVVASLRVALVAYRDRRSEDFETAVWDFTTQPDDMRDIMWTLTVKSGVDHPEAVYPALRDAYTKLTWDVGRSKTLVLIGDAPPHVGFGTQCVDMAVRAREHGVTSHVIECTSIDEQVKHFAEIAEAGGGRRVELPDGASLVGEIAGLTIGDRYEPECREFFRTFLELCR